MLKFAFSTVACPTWTLERVANFARETGFAGVELRTLGYGSRSLACDPALSAGDKVEAMFRDAGVAIAGVGTSARFDAPVTPPVVGFLRDNEQEVREAERHLDVARSIGASYTRVFAFEPATGERTDRALKRIVARIRLAADHARWGSGMLALENGGGFPRAADVLEIVDRARHPLVGACYNVAVGARAGDDADAARELLAGDLLVVRVKDVNEHGKPCLPGDGVAHCEALVRNLASASYAGWVVFEWDRAWLPDLASLEESAPEALERMQRWATSAQSARLDKPTAAASR